MPGAHSNLAYAASRLSIRAGCMFEIASCVSIRIRRGFIASGTTRASSTESRPFDSLAEFTLTCSANWKRCSNVLLLIPR